MCCSVPHNFGIRDLRRRFSLMVPLLVVVNDDDSEESSD